MIAPALVAATAALPFGVVNRLFNWFNGTEALANDLDGEEFDVDDGEEDEEESRVTIPFERRSIRIKNGEQVEEEELHSGEEEEDSDEYEDEYEYEYEDEEEEYEVEDAEEESADEGVDEDEPAIIPLKIGANTAEPVAAIKACLLYTSPSPRDQRGSRMPSSA